MFGIAITAQKPPAAAAAVPVSRFSLYSWPGVRRCTCGSTNPGNACMPWASIGLAVLGRFERSRLAELGDVAVLDEDVVRLVEPGARIEHVGAGDQQLRGLGRSVEEALGLAHHATAARLGAPTSNS